MRMYHDSGYLNIPEIEKEADRNGINFIVLIGGRQVGKTYGTLKQMIDNQNPFILLRRSATEMEFICNDINSPFRAIDSSVHCKKDGKYTGGIFDAEENRIGTIMALSCVAKIRGFDGSDYTDLVFDEFIPEQHVTKIRDEGDAFLNALVTISGNRELDGKKPLRVWLLANSNNIASPVLDSLNIQNKIDQMLNKGQELTVLKDRGIMILLPSSKEIMEKRKKTALIRAINGESRFTEMAFENKFSYNDSSNIKNANLKEYIPVFTLAGKFTFYKHKADRTYYVSSFQNGTCRTFMDTDRERVLIRSKYPDLKIMYINGKVYFQDLIVKSRFIDIIKS